MQFLESPVNKIDDWYRRFFVVMALEDLPFPNVWRKKDDKFPSHTFPPRTPDLEGIFRLLLKNGHPVPRALLSKISYFRGLGFWVSPDVPLQAISGNTVSSWAPLPKTTPFRWGSRRSSWRDPSLEDTEEEEENFVESAVESIYGPPLVKGAPLPGADIQRSFRELEELIRSSSFYRAIVCPSIQHAADSGPATHETGSSSSQAYNKRGQNSTPPHGLEESAGQSMGAARDEPPIEQEGIAFGDLPYPYAREAHQFTGYTSWAGRDFNRRLHEMEQFWRDHPDAVESPVWQFMLEEYTRMENEKIDEMFERFSNIINDLHALKKTYTYKELVRKILRSLTPEWRSKADAIQESIGITNVTIGGLRGNLKTYESTILYPSLGEQKKNGIALKASTSQERGQRKRSRTGKNVASSSAPPPSTHKYLDESFLWFNDREETTRFSEKFEHREILPPRFSTARFIHDSIPREARVILERGNFLDLLYIKKVNYQPFLVRAFYSNLKKDEDGSLISNVNGVDIYLNEENIQILTGLRRDGQDLGLYTGEEGARFNETALLEEVGIRHFVPTPQQWRPTISSMSPVYRFIFYVLTRILKPRKFNHTNLSQEDTKTIHAMIHNANINWCKFVMTHMFTATSDNRPLPYALLVMAILEEYNIKTDVGPKIKGTKHWEIDESFFHSGTDETPFRQPRPRRQPRATASAATTSTNPSLAEQ
ncbi:unnamed protein product [Cuscuta campestris]|uniref:Putative plant transposon protein domain-containing protein n=1 Tax=Cuscuta campestris TaxID=132261 RepID=A0A484M214_9ASTE|nr:unnamed protein product [Cuscuta campestris]